MIDSTIALDRALTKLVRLPHIPLKALCESAVWHLPLAPWLSLATTHTFQAGRAMAVAYDPELDPCNQLQGSSGIPKMQCA
jgi:hypothetical protein